MTDLKAGQATSKNVKGTMTGEASRPKKSRSGRISRACDDCRGRKIKCDGNTPCPPCQISHRECTYGFYRKTRYKGPMYVEELEEKLGKSRDESQRLKSLLAIAFPGICVDDRDAMEALRIRLLEGNPSGIKGKLAPAPNKGSINIGSDGPPGVEELLETMTEATGRLDVDGQGRCEYHGDFAGLAFLHQIGERCSQLLHPDSNKAKGFSHLPLSQAFASESSSMCVSMPDSKTMFQLPSRAMAEHLTKIAFNDASCLMTFIHVSSFNIALDRIYSLNPGDYTRLDEIFLPLLYASLALGELFSGGLNSQGPSMATSSKTKGLNYFRASQALVDPADCRNIMSLQAIVCMIIYLQSSASMYSCYSYISIAISVSIQMGLHRSAASRDLDPVQQETRRRIFWVIQTMETYVTTLLGLPTVLSEDDIDQEIPLCVDDATLNSDGSEPTSSQSTSIMAPVISHIKLIRIMRNLVNEIYPRAKQLGSKSTESYRVSYARINKIESDLEQWFQSIPAPTPSETLQPEVLRIQLLLRLAYAHVQMVLYRPFIHHIVRTQLGDVPEMRSFACASACIKAGMQIVWIVEELDNRGLLVGAYWFTVYITFFAVMTLCMFILGNPHDPTIEEAKRAAEKGRRILSRLAVESVSAEKCLASLEFLFDKISLLCNSRQNSSESVTTVGSSDSCVSDPALCRMDPIAPTDQGAHREPILNSAFNLAFEPVVRSVSPLKECKPVHFEEQFSPQQHSALSAMMGPPLDQFFTSTPLLATPVYGELGPLEENQYFPSVTGPWVDLQFPQFSS